MTLRSGEHGPEFPHDDVLTQREREEREERGRHRDESEQGVGKAAVIMDEKTRRGRVGSTGSRERQREGVEGRGREERGGEHRGQGKARQGKGKAGQGRARRTQGPEGSRASDRKRQRQTRPTEWRERSGSSSWWKSRAEPRVGCGGDVAGRVLFT